MTGPELFLYGVPLDRHCEDCGGSGVVHDEEYDEDGECPECEGTGFRLTSSGRAVIALVRRHLAYEMSAVYRHTQKEHQ